MPPARTCARNCLGCFAVSDFRRAKYTQSTRNKSHRINIEYLLLPPRLCSPFGPHRPTDTRCSLFSIAWDQRWCYTREANGTFFFTVTSVSDTPCPLAYIEDAAVSIAMKSTRGSLPALCCVTLNLSSYATPAPTEVGGHRGNDSPGVTTQATSIHIREQSPCSVVLHRCRQELISV